MACNERKTSILEHHVIVKKLTFRSSPHAEVDHKKTDEIKISSVFYLQDQSPRQPTNIHMQSLHSLIHHAALNAKSRRAGDCESSPQ